MVWKPFESKSVLDIRKSTKISYPPKRALPSNNGSFTEMEHYHYDNYDPFGEHPIAKDVEDNCEGRVLRPITQETWECTGEARQPGDDPPQFQVGATGGIGALRYSLDPRWREVNEAGDQVTIDGNGVLQIGDEETIVCSDGWPPWIIYRVCDDCGCSFGTIWLEDCSGDCCTVPCDPLPEVSGADTIGLSSSAQYTLDGAQGIVTWGLSGGSGASIDSDGLVTTTGSACGTAEVKGTDSCCGEFTKNIRLGDATTSQWSLIESLSGSVVATFPCTLVDGCTESGTSSQDCFGGAFKWSITYRQTVHGSRTGCTTCSGCGWNRTDPPLPACFVPGTPNDNHCFWYARETLKYEWIC